MSATFSAPILRNIVLVGGGHSHAVALKYFAMHPMAGVQVTVISAEVETPYSGMLPGMIAGHYALDEMQIDWGKLCAFAGARFYKSQVIGIDKTCRLVLCRDRPPVHYDVLSINTGASPLMGDVPGAAEYAIALKPLAQFLPKWEMLCAGLQANQLTDQSAAALNRLSGSKPPPLRLAVVGAGASGVELALALQRRFPQAKISLFVKGSQVLPAYARATQNKVQAVLIKRGVRLYFDSAVQRITESKLDVLQLQGELLDQTLLIHTAQNVVEADAVFWLTQATPAAWLATSGLALDARGFIRVNEALQAINDERVFAAGDVASMDSYRLEKSGVFAVRQGMPLAINLRRALLGVKLRAYRPQKNTLALISLGQRFAVAARGGLVAWLTQWGLGGINVSGALLWRYKNWIDQKFMQRFLHLPSMTGTRSAASEQESKGPQLSKLSPKSPALPMSPMPPVSPALLARLEPEEAQQLQDVNAMRCGGCGAKVNANIVRRVLEQLNQDVSSDVLVGLQSLDDAAVIKMPAGEALVQTVDFFRAFYDDPYLFGCIAANHALGDIFAMGAKADTALAIVTIPPNLERQIEATLRDMLAGAVEVFSAAGCTLVGGHTGEGAELALGFSVNGHTPLGFARDTSALPVPGELLILTKPLGTGTLFAAQAAGVAKGRWIDTALQQMRQSSQAAAACLQASGASACTDVTGFGFIGHLLNLTKSGGVKAEINLSALPVMPGALQCLQAGLVSSLHRANQQQARLIQNAQVGTNQANTEDARYQLLFDPQTAGGLLASVPSEQAPHCLMQLRALGYEHAAIVGQLVLLERASDLVYLKE